MSSNAARAGPAPAAAQPQQRTDWKWTLARALLMYAGVNAVTNPKSPVAGYVNKLMGREFVGTATPAASDASSAVSSADTAAPTAGAGILPATVQIKGPPNVAIPVWSDDAQLDFYVFVSSGPPVTEELGRTQWSDLIPDSGLVNAPGIPFDSYREDLLYDPLHEHNREAQVVFPTSSAAKGELTPIAAVKYPNFRLGDTSLSRDIDLMLPLNDGVRRANGSIWADMVLTLTGVSPDPRDATYSSLGVMRRRKLLSRLMAVKKKRVEKNLFDKSNSTLAAQDDEEEVRIVGHWHRNLTLAIVQDAGDAGVQLSQLPAPLLQHVQVVRDEAAAMVVAPPPAEAGARAVLEQAYAQGRPPNVLRYPTVFPNDFWQLKEHLAPINESVATLPLHIHVYRQSWFKFQLLASLSDSFDKQTAGGGEVDMIKTMLLETNPWFLALTVLVSILHSLFEFLAFSSDVKHWRNKDDLAGVSVGSILTNVVVQVIIGLYLWDNGEETSWMILLGQGVGVVVECWKLTKAVSVSVVAGTGWMPYKLKVEDKHKLSEEEKRTQEYDRLAFKYVGIAIGPVLVGWAVYSALYQQHRGWWSFTLSTATSFVYAFGFVSLVPQLIVNYKLKSTAGMNSKTFIYKILGTFVDDLFAFCIKMPTLHRLACFRDDLVFFVALWQRWKYGVDPRRRNEFGQVLDKGEEEKEKKVDGGEEGEKEEAAKSSALPAKSVDGLKSRVGKGDAK